MQKKKNRASQQIIKINNDLRDTKDSLSSVQTTGLAKLVRWRKKQFMIRYDLKAGNSNEPSMFAYYSYDSLENH